VSRISSLMLRVFQISPLMLQVFQMSSLMLRVFRISSLMLRFFQISSLMLRVFQISSLMLRVFQISSLMLLVFQISTLMDHVNINSSIDVHNTSGATELRFLFPVYRDALSSQYVPTSGKRPNINRPAEVGTSTVVNIYTL
jgi:hypothetical protein